MLEAFIFFLKWIAAPYLFIGGCVAVGLMWAGYPDSKLKMAAIWPYALWLAFLDWWRFR